MTKKLPLVSIIVTTQNEAKNIGRCLKSIQQQIYPEKDREIIVVDNNSPDETKKIAQRFTKKVFNYPPPATLSKYQNFRGAQLNFGVKKSRGEIIFFPDADMSFDKNLLMEAVDLISQKKLAALYIPETVVGNGWLGKIRNFERSFYNQTPIDAVRIVKKDLFLKVGGFDEERIAFGPDDWDFTKMIKKETAQIEITKAKIYHHEMINLGEYVGKKGKYVPTFKNYIKKWGRDDPEVKKQLGFWYRYFGVFLEKSKWIRLIAHPVLALGMYGLRFLVGFQYLKNERS